MPLVGAAAAARAAEDRDAWDAIYIGAEKVGHTHIKVGTVKDSRGREFYRVQVNTVLSFKRGDDRVNMEVRYGTIETAEGVGAAVGHADEGGTGGVADVW